MTWKNEDTFAGVALIALAIAVTMLSLDMGTGAAGGTLKPNFFPLVCAGGIGLCGVLLTSRGLFFGGNPLPVLIDRRLAAIGALLVIYFWWFAQIDFRLGTFVVAAGTLLAFRVRNLVLLIIYPAALTAILYFGFTRGFDVVLPTWN